MPTPKILIVEDHPDAAYVLRMLFTAWGWEPAVAVTEADAAARLRAPFDMVLLDLMLPDGNGINLLRVIRSMPDPPAVAVSTANDAPLVMAAVSALRPDAVFVKPVETDALRAFMDRTYRRVKGGAP